MWQTLRRQNLIHGQKHKEVLDDVYLCYLIPTITTTITTTAKY